jgi:hypothetical protein
LVLSLYIGKWILTPGSGLKTINPSFSKYAAYFTTSMLSATLDIVYAGAGWNMNSRARLIEPIVDDLDTYGYYPVRRDIYTLNIQREIEISRKKTQILTH